MIGNVIKLSNVPNTFTRLMKQLLKSFISKFVIAYFDDKPIYIHTKEEHLMHLRQVLIALRENKLYINLMKCSFLTNKLSSLGYVMSVDRTHVDNLKIGVIRD